MIISERIITLDSESGKLEKPIRLFAPVSQGTDWQCHYQIDWPDNRRTGFAAGLDSMQAIYLALQKIGFDLYMSAYHATGSLYWQVPKSGYGFPVPKTARDFLVGEDKIYDG